MRGTPQAHAGLSAVINLDQSVPAHHPLRAIKSQVDTVLKQLSPLFDELYAAAGRSSIPPEQLLKALALYAQALKLSLTNFPLATDLAQSYYGIKPVRTADALRSWTNALPREALI